MKTNRRNRATLFVIVLLFILVALSCSQPSDPVYVNSMSYNGVTSLNCTISIPAGKRIHEAVIDVDTNDVSVVTALISFDLFHNIAATHVNQDIGYEESRNWDLSSNTDDDTFGVHILVSSSTDASGHIVIRLRLVANPDYIPKGLFNSAYTWTFTISGFSSAHNLDVTTSALNSSGVAITPNPIDIQ